MIAQATLRRSSALAVCALVATLLGTTPTGAVGATPTTGEGVDLATVAEVNGMSVDRARQVLSDPTARTDARGRLLYADPAPTATPEAVEPQAAPYPLADTFRLHSKPGATRVIHLDFDGTDVTGTWWNQHMGLPAGFRVGWDSDGSPTTFSDAERTSIQEVWQRVAEDFAPFDVDVTTEDPGPASLNRTDGADRHYGTKVLFTSDPAVDTALCGGGCGGIAYLDIFSMNSSAAGQPAFVFARQLSNHAPYLAEAASHEAGHNFGLEHDGLASGRSYYEGHNGWGPIMGASYAQPLSQWSRGEYTDASQPNQDDVAVIRDQLGLRVDEAGGTVGTAAGRLPTSTAWITTRNDIDVYRLGTCSGAVTVTGSVAAVGPNLDLKLTLLREDGTVVTSADPVSSSDRDPATGLGATVSATVASGTYYASVDGVGRGTAATGYTDYGSLGSYRLQAAGCTAPVATAPGAPQSATSSNVTETSATLSWAPPASDGGSPITGYVVSRPGMVDVALRADQRSWTDTSLVAETTYAWTVRARNAVGLGPGVTVQATTQAPASELTRPGRPRIGKASSGARGGTVTATVRWQAPAVDGGTPITGYRILALRLDANGRVVSRARTTWFMPPSTAVQLSLPKKGRWRFKVTARNAVGVSKASALSNIVRGR